MDTELLTALNNLESIIEQIKQAGAGGVAQEDQTPPVPQNQPPQADEDIIMKAIAIMKQMEEDKNKKEKGDGEDSGKFAKKSANSPAAQDPAETQIQDQPDLNLENIPEVAKAIISLLRKSKGVQKSQDPIAKIADAVQLIGKQVMEQNKAIQGILEGTGIVSTVEKAWDEAHPKKDEPRDVPAGYGPDVKKTLDFIQQMAGVLPKAEPTQEQRDPHFLSKSLAADSGRLLTGMFPLNSKAVR